MVLGKMDIHRHNNKFGDISHHIPKKKTLKTDQKKNLYLRDKNIKLKENTGVKNCDMGLVIS